jgi:hypothetical protein
MLWLTNRAILDPAGDLSHGVLEFARSVREVAHGAPQVSDRTPEVSDGAREVSAVRQKSRTGCEMSGACPEKPCAARPGIFPAAQLHSRRAGMNIRAPLHHPSKNLRNPHNLRTHPRPFAAHSLPAAPRRPSHPFRPFADSSLPLNHSTT